MIVYEIMRQVTNEEKAVLLLSRYGISKLLQAVKLHRDQSELRTLLEDLVSKLVRTGHRQLSATVLFKMGTSEEVSSIHPKLQQTAWECLVSLSESFEGQQMTM